MSTSSGKKESARAGDSPGDRTRLMLYALTLIRAYLAIGLFAVWTVSMSLFMLVVGTLGWVKCANAGQVAWTWISLKFWNVKVRSEGLEHIPDQGGGVILFNHQSHFDILVMLAESGKQIRFGAKIELFKIPIFNWAMRACGVLPIARKNRVEVMRMYKMATEKFKQGFVFALAPEGTRQAGPTIGEFRRGPFVFAVEGQVPIIPCVICGAFDVLPTQKLLANLGQHERTIDVRFLPPVSTQGYDNENVGQLMLKVRELMLAEYQKLERQRAAPALAQ